MQVELEKTVGHLAARWRDAGIFVPAFPLLARGAPLELRQIAEATGRSEETVDEALRRARSERDADGRLVELYGLTLRPTPLGLRIEEKVLFACCALWCHVIPLLVGTEVEVETDDPVRHERVRLVLGPEGIRTVEPPGAVASMVTVGPEIESEQEVEQLFCRHVRYFSDAESAAEFGAAESSRYVIELEQLDEAARSMYSLITASPGRNA